MTTISDNTRKLLLEFEAGGGRAYFDRFLARPSWPGVASGVTIGVGWDAGYNSAATLRSDWSMLPVSMLDRLVRASGVKGKPAATLAAKMRDIVISWEDALRVFEDVTIPKFSGQTIHAFPGSERLHADAFGALLSIVFNRGPSLDGPKRKEMREIAALVGRKDYAGMAERIRAMKRLWPGVKGLLRRRDAEARLMESCEGKVPFRF